jgi:D-serine deaminase-like pyridoxal phosphate-dependent protein
VNVLETPALLVDLDGMEQNMLRMSTFFRERPVKLRPHFKAHQVLALASKQIQAGAIGIACARLEHAEALAQHGIENILIANEIVGDRPIQRFADLSLHTGAIVAVDNARVVSDMARVAGNRKGKLNVVVDLDVGLGRCGVLPGEAAVSLATLVQERGLRFRGLMAHRGNLRLSDGSELQGAVGSFIKALLNCKQMIENAGIPVEIVSAGGTNDYSIVGAFSGVTEVQAGSYLLMDTWYLPFAQDFNPSLTVLATVISKNFGRIVLDAGAKTMSGQRGLPSVKGVRGVRVTALHAEHTIVELLDPSVRIEVGDKIEIWVHHLDATISLHRQMYGIRNQEVEEVFRIEHQIREQPCLA